MKSNKHDKLLQIGEIAELAGTTVRTVRYYMEERFIEAAERSPGGFYLFTPETADTVFYIQKLKNAGLALKDIKAVYLARHTGQSGEEASARVVALLESQKTVVAQKLADYDRLKSEIDAAIQIASQCRGCEVKPSRENCEACRVVRRLDKMPLPLRAIF